MSKYVVLYMRDGKLKRSRPLSADMAAREASDIARGRLFSGVVARRSEVVQSPGDKTMVMSCYPRTTSLRKEPGVMFKAGRKAFAECWLDPDFKKKLRKKRRQ